MYFDDVLNNNKIVYVKDRNNHKIFLRDAVVFRIDDSIGKDSANYWHNKKIEESGELDYAIAPFKNIFITFCNEIGIWLIYRELNNYRTYDMFFFDSIHNSLKELKSKETQLIDIQEDLLRLRKKAIKKKHTLSEKQIKILNETNPGIWDYNNDDIDMGFIQNEIDQLKNKVKKEKSLLKTDFVNYEELDKFDLLVRWSRVLYFKKNKTARLTINNGISFTDFKSEHAQLLPESVIFSTFRILCLLNCINIKTTRIKHSNKIQKKRAKRSKLPLVSYHILNIKINKNRHSDKNNGNGYENRIHLCRGHFKKYTKDKPLFGKNTGLWWWQPCVKGKNKKGVVHKEYKLSETEKAPNVEA